VSVADAAWLLDRTTHVVVGVAELVGQAFDLVGRCTNRVVEHSEASRSTHTLASTNSNEVELVNVFVSHTGINDNTRHRVLETTDVAVEDSSVHTLASVDIHQLGLISSTSSTNSSLNLVNLRHTDTLNLALTYTITVEDHSGRISTIVLLKALKRIREPILQSCASFLPNLILDYGGAPVGSSGLVHRSCQS